MTTPNAPKDKTDSPSVKTTGDEYEKAMENANKVADELWREGDYRPCEVIIELIGLCESLHTENATLRKENEKGRLIRKCTRLLLKKLSLNDFGTDRECRQAYKELNAAFEELEEYEKEVGQ